MFVDEIKLSVHSGAGGSGSVSFKKTSTKSSPSGGSGGQGGSVIITVNEELNDLSHIISNSSLKAENGTDGNKNFQNGKKGKDLIIEVPKGTKIKVDNEVYADLHENKSSFIVLEGSKAGRGNYDLISKRVPNPQFCEHGEKRNKIEIKLTYSIYSDLVIVGLPNAGKSTLITKLTNSKAQIADYEFTTTSPNLGILNNSDLKLKICDLPGLIKGASDGVGMGERILRHIRNTKLIVYLLDPLNQSYSLEDQVNLLEKEIIEYDQNFSEIPTIKVVNKLDKSEISIIDSINISAQTGLNIEMLIQNIVEIFQSDKRRLYGDFQKITLQKDDLIINQDHGKYICTGRFVESIIGLSGNKDEVNNEIFYRYENSYLPNKLEELGVVDGDTIMLGNLEFEYKK